MLLSRLTHEIKRYKPDKEWNSRAQDRPIPGTLASTGTRTANPSVLFRVWTAGPRLGVTALLCLIKWRLEMRANIRARCPMASVLPLIHPHFSPLNVRSMPQFRSKNCPFIYLYLLQTRHASVFNPMSSTFQKAYKASFAVTSNRIPRFNSSLGQRTNASSNLSARKE